MLFTGRLLVRQSWSFLRRLSTHVAILQHASSTCDVPPHGEMRFSCCVTRREFHFSILDLTLCSPYVVSCATLMRYLRNFPDTADAFIFPALSAVCCKRKT